MNHLSNLLASLPSTPGCYIFYNNQNQVLYVGKAKNIKNRVNSYFRGVYHSFKISSMVKQVANLKTINTATEKEALILEYNLIKTHKPKYNILLTDDKSYPYIGITTGIYPQYKYIRNLDEKKYSAIFGPFPAGSKARNILKVLEYLYPLNRCGKINKKEPCLFWHIGLCKGQCFQNVDSSIYNREIDLVKDFFSGNIEKTEKKLIQKMKHLADNLQFEEAQKIKLMLSWINWTISDQNIEIQAKEKIDVHSYAYTSNKVAFNTLFFRSGKLMNKTSSLFEKTSDLKALFLQYLQNTYKKNIKPDNLVIEPSLMSKEILLFMGDFIHPETSLERKILNLGKLNAEKYLKENLNQIQLEKTRILKNIKEILQIDTTPNHIEIFDVSNLYHENVVGACVVYKQGQPAFSDYRKYKINSSLNNDFARMKDMLYRRYKKIQKDSSPWPDLIIVDGGKPQIRAALEALTELGVYINIIGLIKDANHKTDYIIDKSGKKYYLDKTSVEFLFFKKIQDSVHNYAIKWFRRSHNKSNVNSLLDEVKGLSTTKINALYKEFKTINNMKSASFEELNSVITNKNTTNRLMLFLKKSKYWL